MSRLRTRKLFIVVFLVALPVFAALDILAAVPQVSFDKFNAIYTLGSAGQPWNYFPANKTDILPGVKVTWYVGVYNHMGNPELVQLRFKILNLTMQGPNQLNETPSQRDEFFEETQLLLSNETWTLPVTWAVYNATRNHNSTVINSLTFNGEITSYNVEISALYGIDFRIVIELWVYDDTTGSFLFHWTGADNVNHVTWNQLWFNMSRTSLLPQS